MPQRGIAGRARRRWLTVPVVAAVLWLVAPALSAIALRPGTARPTGPGAAGRPSPAIPPTTAPVTSTTGPPTPSTVAPTTSVPGGGRSGATTPVGATTPTTAPNRQPSPATTVPVTPSGAGAAPSIPSAVSTSTSTSTSTSSTTTTSTSTTVPAPPAAQAGSCKPDPASAIAALPPGGVFVGSGCYLTHGILITKPVVIDGGVYHDPLDSDADGGLRPIIRVKDTGDVTIEHVQLTGANETGTFHRHLVGEAGLDILSSSHVSILGVSVEGTFGDGLTGFANFGRDGQPTSDLRVDGLRIADAGRQGITMGYVLDSVFDNVTVDSAAEDGWDFESDVPNIGSGNVVVSNSASAKGVRFVEALQGPITFVSCRCRRHITVKDGAARSGQPISFDGGSVLLPNNDHGLNRAGITVIGPGRLFFNGVLLGRLPASWRPKGLAWWVTDGGHLSLHRSPVTGPLGYSDSSSTVVVS